MYVNRLVLDQFRNYQHLDLEVPVSGLRISGRNASGKSSVLEALVMLSTTRSSRAIADRDVVHWTSGADFDVRPYARLEAMIETNAGPSKVGISVELDAERESIARKQFLINGERVRAHDLVGAMKCVLFSPEDVYLVTGSPAERRRQIDVLISQIERSYLSALSHYGKVLSQRNQLLKRFARERRNVRDSGAVTEISFWDEELVSSGSLVMALRHTIAARISELILLRSRELVEGSQLGFAYRPRLQIPSETFTGEIKRDTQSCAALFTSAIGEARSEEFRRGMTVIGPHRDDFTFLIGERELASFGSRGQQRLGVVAYRLAEIDIIDGRSGERPILLLDDVLSELDSVHREMLLTAVATRACQILVTSTDAALLQHPLLEHLPTAEIRDGALTMGQ